MMDALAFLPLPDIAEGLQYLRQQVPDDLDDLHQLLQYFDETYVTGSLRRVSSARSSARLILRALRIPPAVWNVYDATLTGRERTNNVCEGWNNAFATMVGHHHPSLWCLIGALQQDQAMVATALLQNARGQPPAKRCKHSVVQQQQRLYKLCCERRHGTRSVKDTLRALGHCVSLQ